MSRPQLTALLAAVVAAATAAHPASSQPAPPDSARFCDTGLAALDEGDEPTAFAALELCLDGTPSDEHRVAAKKGLRAVTQTLRGGKFAELVLAIEPAEATVKVDAISIPLPAQRTVYVPLGARSVSVYAQGFTSVELEVEIISRDRATLVYRLERPKETSPGAGEVNFENDPPPALPTSRPQQETEFESLVPDKFQKGAPKAGMQDEQRSARWPWVIVGVGAAMGIGGAALHFSGREGAAIGLYIGGASAIVGGAIALSLTRKKNAIPPDPEFAASPRSPGFSIGYAFTW